MAQWDEIQRNRAITLVVAIATLMSNVLSSVLVSQLPDDPFHLARNLGWYLHFANILSVFGFIGAVRVCRLSSHSPFRRAHDLLNLLRISSAEHK